MQIVAGFSQLTWSEIANDIGSGDLCSRAAKGRYTLAWWQEQSRVPPSSRNHPMDGLLVNSFPL